MKNDLLAYAIGSYAFVLPRNGTFTFQEWADEIAKVYDSAEIRHSAVIEEIRKLDGSIVRHNGTSNVFN